MSNVYFANIPESQLKDHYRRLAQRMHPDRGGNTKDFQAMKQEYEERVRGIWVDPAVRQRQEQHRSSAQQQRQKNEYYNRKYTYQNPKIIRVNVKMDVYISFGRDGKASITEDGERGEWRMRLKPTRGNDYRRVQHNDGQPNRVIHLTYKDHTLNLRFKEEWNSKLTGKMIGYLRTPDGVIVGKIKLSYTDVMSSRIRYSRTEWKNVHPLIDLKNWDHDCGDYRIDPFKEPRDMLGKIILWVRRKLYPLFG